MNYKDNIDDFFDDYFAINGNSQKFQIKFTFFFIKKNDAN